MTTLTAIPGTILATAALTSQEALAAVQDPEVLFDPVEAEHFAMVAGVMALQMREKISSQLTGNIGSPISQNILGLASQVMERCLSSHRPYKLNCIEDLRSYLSRINPEIYRCLAETVLQSGLAVFGHAAPAVAAYPVQGGVAAAVENFCSDAAILARRDRRDIAEELAKIDHPYALTILIKKTAEGDDEAADQLRLILNKGGSFTANFTPEHVGALARIKREFFDDFGIDNMLGILSERRPELFSGGKNRKRRHGEQKSENRNRILCFPFSVSLCLRSLFSMFLIKITHSSTLRFENEYGWGR